MDTKWKVSIYGLLGGILVSPIAIFAGLCVFKLGLLIFISDHEWHQAVTIQHLGISFVLAVIGGVGLYFMLKYIGPKIAADCKNYNMKREKLRFKIVPTVVFAISSLGCSFLVMWIIIPMQGDNFFRHFVVASLIFYFVLPKGYDAILYLLKKVHIKDKYLSDVKDICDTNLH